MLKSIAVLHGFERLPDASTPKEVKHHPRQGPVVRQVQSGRGKSRDQRGTQSASHKRGRAGRHMFRSRRMGWKTSVAENTSIEDRLGVHFALVKRVDPSATMARRSVNRPPGDTPASNGDDVSHLHDAPYSGLHLEYILVARVDTD